MNALYVAVLTMQLPFADGARLRVESPALPAPLYGTAIVPGRTSPNFVIVTPHHDAQVTTSLASLSRVSVSEGHHRLTTGLAGAGAGLLVGGLLGGHEGGKQDDTGLGAFVGFTAGALSGAILGGLAGAAFAPERWHNVYQQNATANAFTVELSPTARIKQLPDGVRAVRGERNRRAGMRRGAAVLGAFTVIVGGIDLAGDNISGGDYVGTVVGNALFGGLVGYFISPRSWQVLPK